MAAVELCLLDKWGRCLIHRRDPTQPRNDKLTMGWNDCNIYLHQFIVLSLALYILISCYFLTAYYSFHVNMTFKTFDSECGGMRSLCPAPPNNYGASNQAHLALQSARNMTYFLDKGVWGILLSFSWVSNVTRRSSPSPLMPLYLLSLFQLLAAHFRKHEGHMNWLRAKWCGKLGKYT